MSVKNKSIVLLLGANFLNVFGWALLTPLYALYATDLGASPQEVTFMWSFYTLLAGVLMIVLGWVADRLGNKSWLLTLGYLVQTGGVTLLLAASDLQGLAIGLGVYALGTGVVMPVWKLLYSRKSDEGQEGAQWGFFHGMNTLLISGAAALSGVLFALAGFKGILSFMIGAHALAMIVSVGFSRRSGSKVNG